MTHLLAVIVLIAIVDSANPATIAPALYLALGNVATRSLLGFIAGVFAVNLVGGLLLLIGPGSALLAVVPKPGVEVRHMIELCIGVGLLVVAVMLWAGRRRVADHVLGDQGRIDRSSFIVGAGLTAVEFPTALPYFAAIAAILGSDVNVSTQIGLLAVFNGIFIAPLLAILGVRLLAGEGGQRWLARLRTAIDRRLASLIPALVLLVAAVLVVLGSIGMITD
jgi:Sap-like sulfolipid-1-addressing protein